MESDRLATLAARLGVEPVPQDGKQFLEVLSKGDYRSGRGIRVVSIKDHTDASAVELELYSRTVSVERPTLDDAILTALDHLLTILDIDARRPDVWD